MSYSPESQLPKRFCNSRGKFASLATSAIATGPVLLQYSCCLNFQMCTAYFEGTAPIWIGPAWGEVKDETLGRKHCSQHGSDRVFGRAGSRGRGCWPAVRGSEFGVQVCEVWGREVVGLKVTARAPTKRIIPRAYHNMPANDGSKP